ncbi:MAG TPA: M28 family peptidase [Oscillatoriaceae cyanobacterium]
MSKHRLLVVATAIALAGCQGPGLNPSLVIGRPATREVESISAVNAMDAILSQDDLRADVGAMMAAHAAQSPTMFPRLMPPTFDTYGETPHTGIAQDVAQRFRDLGLTPVLEPFSVDGHDFCNVYADIPARHKSNDFVILSAHHDTWYTPADDNTSGLAILFAAARLLENSNPNSNIRLLAFDGEELNLLGSQAYVQAHAQDHIKLVVNMDCMAFASQAPDSQVSPTGLPLPDTANFLLAVGNPGTKGQIDQLKKLANVLPAALSVQGGAMDVTAPDFAAKDVWRSDQGSFWLKRIPAIFLTDTGPFRDNRYHTDDDTLDSLDWDFFQRTALTTVGAVAEFAGCQLPKHPGKTDK